MPGLTISPPRITPRWRFSMIDTTQNAAVHAWIARHSRYPKAAAVIWALLLDASDREGYVHIERQDLATAAGINVREVSRIRTELIDLNALLREKRPGYPPRFKVNPRISTRLAGPERETAQAAAPPLNLIDLAEARRLRKSA